MTRSEVFIKAGGGSAAAVQLAPDQAKAAYKAGMALCVQNLEKYDPRLAAFSREAASSFGLMASPRFKIGRAHV